MAPRTRPGLLRPLRPLRDASAFVRTLGSSREAIEALVARGLLPSSFVDEPWRLFGRTHVCPCPPPTQRRVYRYPYVGRFDPNMRPTTSPWARAPRADITPACPECLAPPRRVPSRRLLRLLVASGQMLAVEELARDFARRLRAFASFYGADPTNTADWSILATERVVWRLVRRETWRPSFFRYEPHDPQRPDVRVNVHAPYHAAFDEVWPHLDYPLWVDAYEGWTMDVDATKSRIPTEKERIARTMRALARGEQPGDLYNVMVTRSRTAKYSRDPSFLDRVRESGATPHGLTIQAESMVTTARRAAKRWPTTGSVADPFEPLRAILDLGFAVHDVTSRGIEIVCPMPSPTRRTEAARKVAGVR